MMIPRFAIAFVGASVVTIGMLLLMSDFTQRLRERDSLRYFPITDFIPAETRGLPRPPRAPLLPPERPDPQYERRPGQRIDALRPDVAPPIGIDRPIVEPTLDPSRVTPDEAEPQ